MSLWMNEITHCLQQIPTKDNIFGKHLSRMSYWNNGNKTFYMELLGRESWQMIIIYISIILNKSRPELKRTSSQKHYFGLLNWLHLMNQNARQIFLWFPPGNAVCVYFWNILYLSMCYTSASIAQGLEHWSRKPHI